MTSILMAIDFGLLAQIVGGAVINADETEEDNESKTPAALTA